MSKMGISTYMSYTGAQIFEVVGLQKALVEQYFTGTSTQVEGIGVFKVMKKAICPHRPAFGDNTLLAQILTPGGKPLSRGRKKKI